MKELRRILIEPKRLYKNNRTFELVKLLKSEYHYLSRVIRLKNGEHFLVLDGCGNLWLAELADSNYLRIKSQLEDSNLVKIKTPLICLAVVIPKNGFDDILRMTSEIGVDKIQPLTSLRCEVNIKNSKDRWRNIIRESVELSERLWQPELFEPLQFEDWLNTLSSNSLYSIATTRQSHLPHLMSYLETSYQNQDMIWVVIGPEGGWTENELLAANQFGLTYVQLGDSILRTSTAAIVSIESISSWRRGP